MEGSPAQEAAWEQGGPGEGETGGRIWYKLLLKKGCAVEVSAAEGLGNFRFVQASQERKTWAVRTRVC